MCSGKTKLYYNLLFLIVSNYVYKMKNKIAIILLLLFSITLSSKAEEKVIINFTGKTDSLIILANYYGKHFQIVDTIELINQTITINNSDTLKQGVYTLARFNKSKYFDFVIGENPNFQIEANTNNLTDSITATSSLENSYFFKFLHLNSMLYKLSQQSQTKDPSNPDYISESESIQTEIQTLKSDVYKNLPRSVLDIIFKSMEEPKFPDSIKKNQQKQYQYFKSNYWNTITLDDSRMLRTPIFHRKYDFFFNRIVMQQPDTLIKEIDTFFTKKMDPEIYKYLIWELTINFEEPKIMGLDKVFVHIVDNYYKKNKVTDISQGIVDNIIKRADKVRPLLIGEMAPNLIMVDTLGNFDALNNYFSKDYTIILFWDSDCQTCQKEIKELKILYHSNKYDIEVFAVGTIADLKAWKHYIREHNLDWVNVNGTKSMSPDYHDLYNIYSTPTIFVLDKNKKIIGKKISVEQLESFFNNYETFIKAKKN